jgi:glucokinase
MGSSLAIGIDLGGSNLRTAVVTDSGTVLKKYKDKTPVGDGPSATVALMASRIKEICKEFPKPKGVGVGSPGPLSRKLGKIFQTPNLPGFDGFELVKKLEALCEIPVVLDNDAKCAAFAEAKFGAARGHKNFVMLTLGTGIGGGVFEDGHMIYGKSDGACELGHMTLYPEGRECHCHNRGCFEQYCSATALQRRVFESLKIDLKNPEIFERAHKEDEQILKVMKEVGTDLGIGIASLVNIFDPEAVIVGGGIMSEGGEPLLTYAREAIVGRCFESSRRGLKIAAAECGGDAGVLGAASLVLL